MTPPSETPTPRSDLLAEELGYYDDHPAIQLARQLERELSAATADAGRYRWLRDMSVPPHNFYLSVPIEFKDERYTPAQVDSAIDAAISASRKEGK